MNFIASGSSVEQNVASFSFCQAYVAGVVDAMGVGATIGGLRACPPVNVNVQLQQLKDIVWRFLAMHPELRHYPAPELVAQAVACR